MIDRVQAEMRVVPWFWPELGADSGLRLSLDVNYLAAVPISGLRWGPGQPVPAHGRSDLNHRPCRRVPGVMGWMAPPPSPELRSAVLFF